MQWGIGAGLIIVLLVFAFFAYAIFKEAQTHRFWRRKVEEGDLEMITQLVQVEVEHWRAERPPKEIPASVWQGIQAMELVAVGRDFIHASSSAEPRFATTGGARRQVSSALNEAKQITAKLAERLFYDIPHVRADRVQLDIYTTFQESAGEAAQRCILSTLARRSDAAEVDWDSDPPDTIAEMLGARYELDEGGVALPIEPDTEAVRISPDGPSDGSQSAS